MFSLFSLVFLIDLLTLHYYLSKNDLTTYELILIKRAKKINIKTKGKVDSKELIEIKAKSKVMKRIEQNTETEIKLETKISENHPFTQPNKKSRLNSLKYDDDESHTFHSAIEDFSFHAKRSCKFKKKLDPLIKKSSKVNTIFPIQRSNSILKRGITEETF